VARRAQQLELGLGRRRAAALAHRLLAASAVTAAGDGLHTTEVGGSGPRVVFLHGLFGQGKNWTAIAKALAGQARVTMVDLPNHGRSGWTRSLSYVEMADAVADRLSADSDEPVAVVGHSMGGKVAMALALRRPQLVERLVVVDIAPVHYERISGFGDYVTGMSALDLGRIRTRDEAGAGLRPYVPDDVVRSFLLQNLRRDPTSETGWRWQMNLALLGGRLADLGDWPDLETPPYPGPVLWIAGGRSDYITPDYAPAMRALFPRTQLFTVKNSGHWVHSEQPEIFVAAVRRFLGLDLTTR
jgi:pimeloyl-ACP methyl ester carboxylesterase